MDFCVGINSKACRKFSDFAGNGVLHDMPSCVALTVESLVAAAKGLCCPLAVLGRVTVFRSDYTRNSLCQDRAYKMDLYKQAISLNSDSNVETIRVSTQTYKNHR